MAGGYVDVTSTTNQAQRQDLSTAQRIGSLRFGDNNLGSGSGSSNGPKWWVWVIVAAVVLGGIWLWKRRR